MGEMMDFPHRYMGASGEAGHELARRAAHLLNQHPNPCGRRPGIAG